MGPMPDMTGAIVMFAIICGVVGWGLIEFIGWVFQHLSWSWGA